MSSGYNESGLSEGAANVHRALASLQEELEAIDYYEQRADRSNDEALKAVLDHNRDEEVEHAALLMEWLRRNLPQFDQQMRKLLFTSGAITAAADAAEPASAASAADGKGLGLGGLK